MPATPENPDIAHLRKKESIALQSLRCIGALILREMGTRYGRQPGGYAWALVQPLGMVIMLGVGFSLLARSPVLGTSFMLFMGTGFLILQLFLTTSTSVGQSMAYSKTLLMFPRVTWLDALVARYLLNTLVTIVVMLIILAGIILFEDIRTVLDWPRIMLAVTLTAFLGLGVGCLNCFLFMRLPVWQNVWAIMTAPLMLISGVIFLYDDMPAMAQNILWFNPMIHVTGIMRDGFYPIYKPTYISVIYVLTCSFIPMVLGLLLMRQFHRDLLYR